MENTVIIKGVTCTATKEICPDGKKHTAYTFQVDGWDKCTIIGKRNAERVIAARLSPAARILSGIA